MAGWLQDRVALVTGAADGLGRAVVTRFLREGVTGVVAVDRDADGLAALKQTAPDRVVGVVGDVRAFSTHAHAVEQACAHFGGLDILVPNAGVFDFRRPLHGYTAQALEATMDELMSINLRGYLFAVLAARKSLVARRGNIVMTASVASFHAGGGGILYTMAKHAIVGMVRQLALEMSPEVRVNGVGPGGTLTRLRGTEALGHGARSIGVDAALFNARIAAATPLAFAQTPDDHTGLYVLLASNENSRAVTGLIYLSDGGIGARSI